MDGTRSWPYLRRLRWFLLGHIGSLLFGGMACLQNRHPNRFVGFVHIVFIVLETDSGVH
jgi:hypothetical protein